MTTLLISCSRALIASVSLMVLGTIASGVARAHGDHHAHEPAVDLLTQAHAEQARHNFDHALELVDQHLAAAPSDDAARLQKVALHLIRGEFPSAKAACRQLERVSALVVVTCHARVAHAQDAGQRFVEPLTALVNGSELGTLPHELRAWSLSVAGDLATSAGRIDEAQDLYQRSLAEHENPQVRAAWVDLLIAAGEWQTASATIGSKPESLTLRVQRLIVAKTLELDVADEIVSMDRQFQRWWDAGDFEHAREMARFYLDVIGDSDRALTLARINATLQHEPEDRQLLARA
ncbi:MAG: hypothetical protein AAFN07_16375, partial [Pseudomonadota bacterium]